jgi:hypothetical protein
VAAAGTADQLSCCSADDLAACIIASHPLLSWAYFC